ncbi:carbohydrate porin [Calothrix sp. PCC 7507]|uniref:carbohydrate porin n=1 Tax=Calothrix sp. PCC 7507 TaxID=99598 RepID=UPI00029F4881|nr:carbohydrate porin [Calothrix sp. PCC 7507]AFY33500.1 Carbohydrate-selective porin OprB [Calothrix sp. PCC 7507]
MCQQVSDCHKFTDPKHSQKVYLLLGTVASAIFWAMVMSEASSAQVIPAEEASNFQIGSVDPLPVPQSSVPAGKKMLGLQTVPPPPTATGIAPIANPISISVQQQPRSDLKLQESNFIQQQVTKKAPQALPRAVAPQIQKQTNIPLIAVGGEAADENFSSLNLGLIGQGNNPQEQINSNIAPLPPLPGATATQEFTAPLPPTATFNQLLNSPEVANPSFSSAIPTLVPARQLQPTVIQQRPLTNSSALKEPYLQFQGVYVTQGGESSARARVTGVYPISPQALVGATIDLTSKNSSFDDSRREGLNINELYLATSIAGVPNLRFVIGQMDLTSYFDRNSFAKDGASQFFNSVFQTNPALAATGIASRTGLLVNWSVTDNIEAKAAVFSSADRIGDFSLDGFAGEIGIRYGNAIIRGTYASDRDGGSRDSFAESFSIARGNNQFGPVKTDREEAYGLNAEVFIPNLKLGLFGRYGKYENRDLGLGADTYAFGASFLDLLTPNDRLGLAYGRGLSNDSLRRGVSPDVLELFYDFQFLPNLRLGFTVQGRDDFSETVVGVRVKSEFDVTPRGRGGQ